MAIEKYFRPLTVEIRGLVDDGASGFIEGWTTDRVIQGTIHKAQSRSIIAAAQLQIDMSHFLYSDYETPIYDAGEEAIKRINDNGTIYEFRSEPENVAERNHHFKTKLRRIDSA